MRIIKLFLLPIAFVALFSTIGCNDTKSYAELLTEENKATNSFLVNQRVESSIPADTVFQVGPNAPYYQLDDEGNVFMQVLNPGTKGNKPEYDQLIYFRFTRYSLYYYSFDKDKDYSKTGSGFNGEFSNSEGNDSDLTFGSASFRFGNSYASSSYQWGSGLQMPLIYLPIDCEVNLVVKSQLGINSEISQVTPYLYKIRYFKSQI